MIEETLTQDIADQEYEKADSVDSFSKLGSNIMENYLDTLAQKGARRARRAVTC